MILFVLLNKRDDVAVNTTSLLNFWSMKTDKFKVLFALFYVCQNTGTLFDLRRPVRHATDASSTSFMSSKQQ